MSLQNQAILAHVFLSDMYEDSYYPKDCVDQVKAVLVAFCQAIETEKPQDLAALYALSTVPTLAINDLMTVFDEAGSDLETVARECMADDFATIAECYGFADADIETLIEERDW